MRIVPITHFACSLVGSLALASACSASRQTATDPVVPHADAPTACALDAYAPLEVVPHFEEERAVKLSVRRLRGAEVFIHARPGLTAEWLRAQLSPRAATASSCALDVAGAVVRVDSAGPGFLITIRVRDEDAATEVLRRARVRTATASR
jgi:hypothetical protein